MYQRHGHRALQDHFSELRSKGEKLTFQDLQATLSPTDNNLTTLFTNLANKLGEAKADATNLSFIFSAPGQALIEWKQSKPAWSSDNTDVTWVTVNHQVATNAAVLTKLQKFLAHPAPNGGWRNSIFEAATPYRASKNVALWLECKGLVSLHEGQKEEAAVVVEALANLANFHWEEYSLVSQMSRCQTAEVGLGFTWQALQAEGWTEEQLLKMQQCWVRMDILEGLERGIKGERAFGLELLRLLRTAGWNSEKVFPSTKQRAGSVQSNSLNRGLMGRFYLRNTAENDFAFQLRYWQAVVEQVRGLRAGQPWEEVLNAGQQSHAQIQRKFNSPVRFLYLLTLLTTVNPSPAIRTAAHIETERCMAITAIALKRYQLKYGKTAPSLEALVPEFLASIPKDCMSGQVLRYKLNPDSNFTLYSVGDDGNDDGGDATHTKLDGKLGLWEGRDAVWPTPAVMNETLKTASNKP